MTGYREEDFEEVSITKVRAGDTLRWRPGKLPLLVYKLLHLEVDGDYIRTNGKNPETGEDHPGRFHKESRVLLWKRPRVVYDFLHGLGL